jgi:protein-tyrosine phosphatase
MTVRVLFVCLGNICRSPMAEAIFQRMVDEAGLSGAVEVASAGTSGYHEGELAHPGTRRVLARHGIEYGGRARQVQSPDVGLAAVAEPPPDVTYIIAMDHDNLADLRQRFGDLPRLYRLLDFATHTPVRDVPDPYYSNNFDQVYRLVEDGCRGLLAHIRHEQHL